MGRLVRLTRPYRRRLALVTTAGAVALACSLSIPALTKRLIDQAILGGDRSLVWPLGLAALGVGALRALMNFTRRNLAGRVSVRVEADLRSRLFAHLQGMPLAFHQQWQTGQLLARATSDLTTIRTFLSFGLVVVFLPLTFVGVAVMLASLDVTLALVTLGMAVPYTLTAVRFSRRMRPVVARSREGVGEVASVVEDSVGGIRVLKAFGQEGRSLGSLEVAAGRLRDVNLEGVGITSRFIPALALIPNLVVAVVLGLGGVQVIAGRLSLGGLVAFDQYLALLLVPLRYVGWMLAMGQQAAASADRVFSILETHPTLVDAPDADALPPGRGAVTFEDVTVIHAGSRRPLLADLSLTVGPHEVVALVGASGSGKSTLATLVSRLADPTCGRVLVDGIDIRTVTLSSLRRQVGVVFDEPVLFRGSVGDNVAFGRPDADDEEVEWAARVACAHDFVTALPDGYATPVGEDGYALSGGQRQRIALARAVLLRPAVLVLDDPFSYVDVHTEAEIAANLRSVFQGRTVLLVARRASTVALADRVVVLDGGRLVASGTAQELAAASPAYRRVLDGDLPAGQAAPARGG